MSAWTPERVRRAVEACARGDLAESVALAAAVIRAPHGKSFVRQRCEYGLLDDATSSLPFSYSIAPAPPAFVPDITPWHPFADALEVPRVLPKSPPGRRAT